MRATEIDKLAIRDGDPMLFVAHPGSTLDYQDALKKYTFLLYDHNPALLVRRAGLRKCPTEKTLARASANLAVISILAGVLLRAADAEVLTPLLWACGTRIGEPNTIVGLRSLSRYGRDSHGSNVSTSRQTATLVRASFDQLVGLMIANLGAEHPLSVFESLCEFHFPVEARELKAFCSAVMCTRPAPTSREDFCRDLLLTNRFFGLLAFAYDGDSVEAKMLQAVLFGSRPFPPALLSGWRQNLPELFASLRAQYEANLREGLRPFLAADLAASDCFVSWLRTGKVMSFRNSAAVNSEQLRRFMAGMLGDEENT